VTYGSSPPPPRILHPDFWLGVFVGVVLGALLVLVLR